MAAVREPDRRTQGRREGECWFFTHEPESRRWLQVVVHYEGGDGWDSHGIPARLPSTAVMVAGVEFDNVEYDRRGDVLYLNVGDPASAVEWDGTAEGDGTSYGPDGRLVGMTILNARLRLEENGKIALTLPERRVELRDLGELLS